MPSRPIVNTAGYAPTLATHFIVLGGSQMSLASASSPALRELRHEPHLRQLGDRPPASGRGTVRLDERSSSSQRPRGGEPISAFARSRRTELHVPNVSRSSQRGRR